LIEHAFRKTFEKKCNAIPYVNIKDGNEKFLGNRTVYICVLFGFTANQHNLDHMAPK
jgi:hypothetical protein